MSWPATGSNTSITTSIVDSLRTGTFDANLDGIPEEEHPEWQGALDWLGVQYYFRAGVTGTPGLIPSLGLTPCFRSVRLRIVPAGRRRDLVRPRHALRVLCPRNL
jgi:hypothetical protein